MDSDDLFAFGFKGKNFALTNVSTNFTPEGAMQQLQSGFPIHTNLRLTFTETEPLYRSEVATDTVENITHMLEENTTIAIQAAKETITSLPGKLGTLIGQVIGALWTHI